MAAQATACATLVPDIIIIAALFTLSHAKMCIGWEALSRKRSIVVRVTGHSRTVGSQSVACLCHLCEVQKLEVATSFSEVCGSLERLKYETFLSNWIDRNTFV